MYTCRHRKYTCTIFLYYTSNSNCPIKKTLFVPRDNVIFHCISLHPTRTACAMEYILYFMATRVCPACCHEIQNIFHGTRGIHEL